MAHFFFDKMRSDNSSRVEIEPRNVRINEILNKNNTYSVRNKYKIDYHMKFFP